MRTIPAATAATESRPTTHRERDPARAGVRRTKRCARWTAHREFIHVGLGDHDRAGGIQSLYGRGGVWADVPLEDFSIRTTSA